MARRLSREVYFSMSSLYDSIDPFLKHVVIAATKPKPHSRVKLVNIGITPTILSTGRQTPYTMNAIAKYDDHNILIARYTENRSNPRIHDNMEDGKLDLKDATREFVEEIVEELTGKGLISRVNGQSIAIEVQH